jgi:hypothetical protein
MTKEQTRVANLIREAFQGVVLGDGVGMLQANAMDGGSAGEAERQKDEKMDWSKIPSLHIDFCRSSLILRRCRRNAISLTGVHNR